MDAEENPPGRSRGSLVGGALVVVAIVAVLGLLLVGLLQGGVETSIRDALAAGERPAAPELGLPVLLTGDPQIDKLDVVDVEDLAGRPVVINFWASWCTACKTESPLLESLWQRYRSEDVLFLGVDAEDLSGKARDFAKEYGLTYPSLRDGTDATKRRWGVTGYPETYILDAEGRVAARIVGEVTRAEQITTPLDQLL